MLFCQPKPLRAVIDLKKEGMVKPKTEPFRFKQFAIQQDECAMKVGTDGVLLGAWVPLEDARRILDIGTGTGVIAIMLAQRSAEARIQGVEVDEASCKQAAQNMAACPWADRLEAVHQPIQEFTRNHPGAYDLLVCNPPFFTGGTFSGKDRRDAVRHTTKLPHGDLLAAARELLNPAGRLAVVLPHIEGLRFIELAEQYQLYGRRLTRVFTKPGKPVERLLILLSKKPGQLIESELTIQDQEPESWTPLYRNLTRDFYLFL